MDAKTKDEEEEYAGSIQALAGSFLFSKMQEKNKDGERNRRKLGRKDLKRKIESSQYINNNALDYIPLYTTDWKNWGRAWGDGQAGHERVTSL